MKEREFLENLKVVSDFYYKKTEDKWYQKVSKQTERKLDQVYDGRRTRKHNKSSDSSSSPKE